MRLLILLTHQHQLHLQTRQLNIWGFERIGPKRDGWKHKKFIRGQPDLLEHIVRTEVKTTVMLTSLGNVSPRTSRNEAKSKKKCSKSTKMEIDADEESSFSSLRTGIHSPDLLSYEEGYSTHLDDIKNNVQRFSCSEEATRVTNTKLGQEEVAGVAEAQTDAMSRAAAAGTSISNTVGHGTYRSLPLDDHASMYLANIFDKHERERPSHEDVLCSILKLDRETTVKTLCSTFEDGLIHRTKMK